MEQEFLPYVDKAAKISICGTERKGIQKRPFEDKMNPAKRKQENNGTQSAD